MQDAWSLLEMQDAWSLLEMQDAWTVMLQIHVLKFNPQAPKRPPKTKIIQIIKQYADRSGPLIIKF